MDEAAAAAARGGGGMHRVFTGFLVIACSALAVLVVMLASQNAELKEQIAAASRAPSVDALGEGDAVGPVGLVDARGGETELRFDEAGPATLVLVVSGTCDFCARTVPVWNGLFAGLPPERLRVVGIEVGGPPGGTASLGYGLRVPLHTAPGAGSTWLRRIPMVPAAVLVNPGGVVAKVWLGEPGEADRREMAALAAGEL